jgi:hypothetical protein
VHSQQSSRHPSQYYTNTLLLLCSSQYAPRFLLMMAGVTSSCFTLLFPPPMSLNPLQLSAMRITYGVEHDMSDNFSSASLLQESTKASAVDYRCFRPSALPTEPHVGAESDRFNTALQFKRPVSCSTDLPTLPTAAELDCIPKKFKWDAFQLIAAGCILKGESVLVCAHTSSGKTVVGEFAVARALAAGQRIL